MRVISGILRGTHLTTLDGFETRPTTDRVKEGIFNAIQFDLPGKNVLDLFAGSGQMGIEALSRGAARATFVDASNKAVRIVKQNLKKVQMEHLSQVITSDYTAFLKSCHEQYGIIFLDPPYMENYLENALLLISEIDILETGGIIVCERPCEKNLPLPFRENYSSKEYKYGKIRTTIIQRND